MYSVGEPTHVTNWYIQDSQVTGIATGQSTIGEVSLANEQPISVPETGICFKM